MTPGNRADTIIIGAGAAGLMAAASAAARGHKVLLLEKNRKLGVKILISGGTRCNITHHCDARGIIDAFGPGGRFLHSALAALSPTDVVEIFNRQGVATKVESTGKIFPVSDRAIDVRDALVELATASGAEILNEKAVVNISLTAEGFRVDTRSKVFDAGSRLNEWDAGTRADESGTDARAESPAEASSGDNRKAEMSAGIDSYYADAVIITTGGRSYPGCGTTGDGYAWAKQFGHSIVRTVPALTPITCNESWANELKGITLEDTGIGIWNTAECMDNTSAENIRSAANDRAVCAEEPADDSSGTAKALELANYNAQTVGGKKHKRKKPKPIDVRRGSFLFTHFGFSGPAALNVSRAITRRESPSGLTIALDFLPKISHEQLSTLIRQHCQSNGRQIVANHLSALLPSRLAEKLLVQSGIDLKTRNAELSKAAIQTIVSAIKNSRLPVSGTLGFNKAEVTSGGVSLSEVDSRTMESKFQRGLFFAGEILDLDGLIGGFNFQSAFSTGWLAGQNV